MRYLALLCLLSLTIPASVAAPVATASSASSPEAEGGGLILEEATFEIPLQTVNGWYERGDPEREARNLQEYLKALIWGADIAAQEAAMAQGRQITVDLDGGLVTLRETPENIDRIGNELDPGLQPMLRRRILARDYESNQAATNISSLPVDAGSGLISRRPRTNESAQTGRGSATIRRQMRYDDSATFFGDLRLTLLDVYSDESSAVTVDDEGEETVRLTALFDAVTPRSSSEFTVVERRSTIYENYRIRLVEADVDPEQRVVIEVTDLSRAN
ncbi:hypothetical protein JXA47_08390 [Candidatus Sumerlaeota bacterium]|nr:hypothetical protein [Candidatus Sumerlaeota bacterium]